MEQTKDSYLTIEGNAEAIFKEKSSKFLCYAFHVESEEEITAHLERLRKQYYDATHHCYAWRLGPFGERFRANDDGEPSSTAGKPILGQMLSREVTNCLIVVVRYFGGTKLGVPGLIAAYKESAAAVLDEAKVVWIPGSAFGECGEGFARVAYTCGEEELYEAIDRVRKFCEKLNNQEEIPQ